MSILAASSTQMEQALTHLQEVLATLRTARATPSLLDTVRVDAYGQQMILRDLASITVPEARKLLVVPFDRQLIAAIAKGIEKANLGFLAVVEREQLRIQIPPLDRTMRQQLVKQAKKRAEESKITIREIRRKSNDVLRKQKGSGMISADQLRRQEKEIQELTDRFCHQIDALVLKKESEILAV